MGIRKRLIASLLVVGAMIPASALWAVPPANAQAMAFYVDNRPGSACSDTGPGTSPVSPWCSFTPVNERAAATGFGPGDHILLARGATWNQELSLRGKGALGNYAIVDAYGEGPRPRITRNGQPGDRGIRLYDPSYWHVRNLEISHAGVGILVFLVGLGQKGLAFTDLYLHDIAGIHAGSNPDLVYLSAGIEITGTPGPFGQNDHALEDVVIDNVEGTRNVSTISFDWNGGLTAPKDGTSGFSLVRNVRLSRLHLHGDDGAGRSPGCEGLRLVNVSDVVVLNSRFAGEAACYTATGTAGVFIGRAHNVNFVNTMLTGVPDTGSPDQTAVDFETKTAHVNIRNSYIAGNAGPGVVLQAIWGGDDYSVATELSGNYFRDNGLAGTPCAGAIARGNNQTKPTGTIRDNLYREPIAFTRGCHGGDFSGFTLSNNIPIVGEGHYAANDYSATQGGRGWRYQYRQSNGWWTDLVFDPAADKWRHPFGAAAPSIERFGQTPEACEGCWVARAWTAPVTGAITIRGRVLKAVTGGNGVVARVTVNNRVVWGPVLVTDTDGTGFDTPLQQLAMRAGDVVRFEVSANGDARSDATSWVPMIGYPGAFEAVGQMR